MTFTISFMTQPLDFAGWALHGYEATFKSSQFCANVDVLNPSRGLADLQYCGAALEGYVLAISPYDHGIDAPDEVTDIYVRGTDLVVTYAQTADRPFALQIYWRVSICGDAVVRVDAIVSLQTSLLESYPNLWACADLPGEIADGVQSGFLLRGSDPAWSYAELVQAEDRGVLRNIDTSGSNRVKIAHQLDGQFLEKGVIRRLRVRGLFLPRANDIKLAERYGASLSSEELPLTV